MLCGDYPATVTDYLVARAGSITRVAQVNGVYGKPVLPRVQEKTVNRVAPAGMIIADLFQRQAFNGAGCFVVELNGGFVVMVVAQIRTDDDHCPGPVPEMPDNLTDLFWRGIPDNQWYQCELVQYELQKGQVHLKAVFQPMGLIVYMYLWQGEEVTDRSAIKGYGAERGFKTIRAGRCKPVKSNPVRGAQQDNLVDVIGRLL